MICLLACLLFANACLPGSSKNLIVPFLLTNTYLSSYLWILRTLTCLLKFPYLHLYLWKSMKTHLQKEQLLIWTDSLWRWSTPVITNRRFYCSFAYAARKNFFRVDWKLKRQLHNIKETFFLTDANARGDMELCSYWVRALLTFTRCGISRRESFSNTDLLPSL